MIIAIIAATGLALLGVKLFLDTEPRIESNKGRRVFLAFFATSYLALLLGLRAILFGVA